MTIRDFDRLFDVPSRRDLVDYVSDGRQLMNRHIACRDRAAEYLASVVDARRFFPDTWDIQPHHHLEIRGRRVCCGLRDDEASA